MTKALLAIIRRQIAEVANGADELPRPSPEHVAATLRSISQLLADLDRRIDALERRPSRRRPR
jgi:hypothetical protein